MKVPEKLICDICGKEIKIDTNRYKIKYDRREKSLICLDTNLYLFKGKVDVCSRCYKELSSLVREKVNKDD